MTYSIMLLFVFVSLSYVYCQNNAISPNTTQTTPALNKDNIQVTTSANSNSSSSSSSVIISSSSVVPTDKFNPPQKVECGDITCSMYQECDDSERCYCPIYVIPKKKEKACGSDGNMYNSIEELKMKACKHERDITVVESHYCTDLIVTCKNITCSMYQKCTDSGECFCPSYVTSKNKYQVCGSDGHYYSSIEELKTKACIEKSNVTEAENDFCENLIVTCGNITCSKYQRCNDFNKCFCPTYPIKTNRVCGSDGHFYTGLEVLKMKACNEKSNLTRADNDKCKDPLVNCGTITCSKYETCEKNKCVCPHKVISGKKEKVCGSDGHVYNSLEELKMKACKEKRDVSKAKNDHCKSWQKKSSNKKTITIIVIISLLLILVLVIVVILFLKKRREALSISQPKKDKSKDALL